MGLLHQIAHTGDSTSGDPKLITDLTEFQILDRTLFDSSVRIDREAGIVASVIIRATVVDFVTSPSVLRILLKRGDCTESWSGSEDEASPTDVEYRGGIFPKQLGRNFRTSEYKNGRVMGIF